MTTPGAESVENVLEETRLCWFRAFEGEMPEISERFAAFLRTSTASLFTRNRVRDGKFRKVKIELVRRWLAPHRF